LGGGRVVGLRLYRAGSGKTLVGGGCGWFSPGVFERMGQWCRTGQSSLPGPWREEVGGELAYSVAGAG